MTTPTKRRSLKEVPKVPKDPNQRAIKRLFPPRKSLRKSLAPTYYPVSDHIYYDGYSFRVRVRTEGKTKSWNTPDKDKALQYRDYLLLARE
jgi:hypothetical protein